MDILKGKIALVTGGTRGIGKGIVIALAKAGAVVYFTGRTEKDHEGAVNLSGSLSETENEGTKNGGVVIGLKCDHTQDAGVRAHYVASCLAAPMMIKQKESLIVNISYWAAQRNDRGIAYCTAKAATDKLTATMAYEYEKYNVSVISLYPGLVRTEAVLAAEAYFDLTNSESPEFIGRAIVALASDTNVITKSGKVYVAAQLAVEYEFTDIDGKQPLPLTLETS